MRLSEISRFDDQATGITEVSEADIIERVDTFNNFHKRHHVDYELKAGGDFTLTLYSEFPVWGALPIGEAHNTLDIDEFWAQANEPAEEVAA